MSLFREVGVIHVIVVDGGGFVIVVCFVIRLSYRWRGRVLVAMSVC